MDRKISINQLMIVLVGVAVACGVGSCRALAEPNVLSFLCSIIYIAVMTFCCYIKKPIFWNIIFMIWVIWAFLGGIFALLGTVLSVDFVDSSMTFFKNVVSLGFICSIPTLIPMLGLYIGRGLVGSYIFNLIAAAVWLILEILSIVRSRNKAVIE